MSVSESSCGKPFLRINRLRINPNSGVPVRKTKILSKMPVVERNEYSTCDIFATLSSNQPRTTGASGGASRNGPSSRCSAGGNAGIGGMVGEPL